MIYLLTISTTIALTTLATVLMGEGNRESMAQKVNENFGKVSGGFAGAILFAYILGLVTSSGLHVVSNVLFYFLLSVVVTAFILTPTDLFRE